MMCNQNLLLLGQVRKPVMRQKMTVVLLVCLQINKIYELKMMKHHLLKSKCQVSLTWDFQMMEKQQNGRLKLKLEIPTYLCKMVIQMSYLALVLFWMLMQVNYGQIHLVPQLNHLEKIVMQ